jgi:hypothetical protein
MMRRITAVAVTVFAAIIAGALRTPGSRAFHEHDAGVGPLGAAVALVMTMVAVAVLAGMLRPRRAPRR